jgi:hypothetical protein
MTASTLTIQNNNPFALIQKTPDKWQGLVNKLPSGFLIFDGPTNGARAGWINLYNTYLKRGLNTPNQIFPIYAPDSGGKNSAYVNFVAKRLGITPDTPITTPKQIWELGRAIVHFEAGRAWLPDATLLEGYRAAQKRVALPALEIVPEKPKPDKPKKKSQINPVFIIGLAAALAVGYYFYQRKK